MLRLVSAGPIRIVPPWDGGDDATAFTITQASAEDWAALDAAVEAQRGGKDGVAAARMKAEQMREQAARYVQRIENANALGDALTARGEILTYLASLNALHFGWLLGCIQGVNDVTVYEKKVLPSPCAPSPNSSDTTKKAKPTPTTAGSVAGTN